MPAAERREQLLDAALQILARDGYSAVSIDAIARSIDVTRPVVYNVFAGLDELLYALLDREEHRALDALSASITIDVDLQDLDGFLRRTVERLVSVITTDPMTWQLIFMASAGSPAAVRERVDRDREIVRTRVRSMVELVMSSRGIAGVDADVVAHALIALGEYFGRLLLSDPAAVDAERLSATLAGVLAAARA